MILTMKNGAFGSISEYEGGCKMTKEQIQEIVKNMFKNGDKGTNSGNCKKYV